MLVTEAFSEGLHRRCSHALGSQLHAPQKRQSCWPVLLATQLHVAMQSNTMAEVRDVLREVRLTIGSEGDAGERERQQARVKRMLTAMGVSEDDLDAELREHKLQQEADAAALPEELQPNGDAHVGVAGGIPQQEGVGQDGDVEMDVEGVDMDVQHGQPGTRVSLL